MKNGFSTINCQKSCQRPTEIFLFSKYPCTTLTVEQELDVTVGAHENSLAWLNFSKTLCFGFNNLSQIDVKRYFFCITAKSQGKTKFLFKDHEFERQC